MNNSSNKNKIIITIGITVIAVLSVILVILLIMLHRMRAATMRLSSYEGSITLTDENGKSLEVKEDRRLTNGNLLKTKKESRAWILLDEDRMVTLMERSAVSFIQDGRELQLSLEEGRLFFNIERSLEDDEDLNIATSTMIIGIRGTSGYVDSDENGNSVLYLTTGKVVVVGLDDDGEEVGADKIGAGQKITVTSGDDAELITTDLTEYDLPRELIEYILSDDELLEAILNETGWDEDLLRMRLSSEDDTDSDPEAVSDISDYRYSFDVNELTGSWYENGVQLFDINGDGNGILYWPSDGMFGSDEGSLVPITMTYDASPDYLTIKDPVHYPYGTTFNYFLLDGKLVLYDGLTDSLVVKDPAFDPGDGWRNYNNFHPAQALTSSDTNGGDSFITADLVGTWEDPNTFVQIEIYENGTGRILGAANPSFDWWVEGNTVFFSNEYLKYENGVLLRGTISKDGVVWDEMRKD